MQIHQVLTQLGRYLYFFFEQVGIHAVQEVVRVPIVARLLLLSRDQYGGLGRFDILFEAQVQFEQVFGVFWHAVMIAHQIFDK